MEQLWQDVRYSVRALLQTRTFTASAVLMLGLAIGVHTAVLRVVNGLLFKPISAHAPHELRYLYTTDPPATVLFGGTRYREFEALRETPTVFSGVAATSLHQAKVRVGNYVDRVYGEAVSHNYFETLGVAPLLGREFEVGDEPSTAEAVVVISYQFWKSSFQGDVAVLGRTFEVNRSARIGSYGPWKRYTIVGVMPDSFYGLASPWEPTQFWIPFLQRAEELVDHYRANGMTPPDIRDFWVLPIGRLGEGRSDAQASAEIETFSHLFRANRPGNDDWALRMYDTRRIQLPFDPEGKLVPERLGFGVFAASSALLLIVGANLAGMLLAQGVSRRSEHALRIALGCGLWRLCRQQILGPLLLSIAGGAVGLLLSRWLLDILVHDVPLTFIHGQSPALSTHFSIDYRVLALVALSSITIALVSVLPLLRTLRRSSVTLGAGSAGSTPIVRRAPWYAVLVPQICLSLALLITAGLLVRTLVRSEFVNPGYDENQVVLLDFELPEVQLPAKGLTREFGSEVGAQRRTIQAALVERARSFAQISSASVSLTTLPYGLPFPSLETWVVSQSDSAAEGRYCFASHASVGSEYFATLRLPILRGRVFNQFDVYGSPGVIVVSALLARQLWPDHDPLGRYIGVNPPGSVSKPKWLEVIGVVGDVEPPLSDGARPSFYTPAAQQLVTSAFTIVARGEGTAADLLRMLSAAAAATDSSIAVSNGRTLHDAIDEMVYPRRAVAGLLVIAGVMGLVVASFGLYGAMSFSVMQRTREIGVRIALGAERRNVIYLILREGMAITAIGLSLGIAMCFALIKLASGFLIPLPSGDPITFTIVAAFLTAVIIMACYLPASRASRVDPRETLRSL